MRFEGVLSAGADLAPGVHSVLGFGRDSFAGPIGLAGEALLEIFEEPGFAFAVGLGVVHGRLAPSGLGTAGSSLGLGYSNIEKSCFADNLDVVGVVGRDNFSKQLVLAFGADG